MHKIDSQIPVTCLILFLGLEGIGKATSEAKIQQLFCYVQSEPSSARHRKYMPPGGSIEIRKKNISSNCRGNPKINLPTCIKNGENQT